jgi:hypothetical protein
MRSILARSFRNLLSIIRPNIPAIFFDTCEPDSLQLSLETPWIADGHVWATDGRIAVWAHLDNLSLSDRELRLYDAGERRVPDIQQNINEVWHHAERVKLLNARRMIPCEECRGSRRSEFDPDYLCYDCGGTGEQWNTRPCKIGDSDTFITHYYAALLREHGVESVLIPLRDEWPVRFDTSVFGGLLMTVKVTRRDRARTKTSKNEE